MSTTAIAIGIALLIIGYGVGLFVLSHFAGKKINDNAQEFYVGGRSVGAFSLTGTILMSLMSVLVILGYTSGLYRSGIGFFSGIVGVFMAAGLYLPTSYRLWLLSGKYHYTTPTDFFYHRFRSKPYAIFLTVMYVICIIPYISVQISGVAKYIASSTDNLIPYWIVAGIFAVYIVLHTIKAGNKAVVATDAFAGWIALGIMAICTIIFVNRYFGNASMIEVVSTIQNSANANVLKVAPAYKNPIGVFGFGLAVGGAIMTWPHFMQRSFMAKNEKVMCISAIGMALGYVLIMGLIYFWGIFIAPYAFPGLTGAATENIVSQLAVNAAPILACVIALGAFAFGLSTADSFTVTAVGFIQNNLLETDKEKQVKQAKWWITGLMTLTLIVNYFQPPFLITYAYQFATPGFAMLTPSLFFGLWWRRATKEGAFAGLVVGFLMILYITVAGNPWPTMHVLLWGLIPNIIIFVLVSLMTKPDEKAVNEIVIPLEQHFLTRRTSAWKAAIALSVVILFIANIVLPFTSDTIYIGWVPLVTIIQLTVGCLWALFAYLWYKTRMHEPDGSIKEFVVSGIKKYDAPVYQNNHSL